MSAIVLRIQTNPDSSLHQVRMGPSLAFWFSPFWSEKEAETEGLPEILRCHEGARQLGGGYYTSLRRLFAGKRVNE